MEEQAIKRMLEDMVKSSTRRLNTPSLPVSPMKVKVLTKYAPNNETSESKKRDADIQVTHDDPHQED